MKKRTWETCRRKNKDFAILNFFGGGAANGYDSDEMTYFDFVVKKKNICFTYIF